MWGKRPPPPFSRAVGQKEGGEKTGLPQSLFSFFLLSGAVAATATRVFAHSNKSHFHTHTREKKSASLSFPARFLPPLFFFSPQRSSEFFSFPFPFFLGEILVCDARSQPPRTEKGQGYNYCTHSSLSLFPSLPPFFSPLSSSFLFLPFAASLGSVICGTSKEEEEDRKRKGKKEK